ncbi:hypothetical protein J6590_025682 [Homalodisca vitripennis]|nr:hypothetical protein J6590_025682 [Homalodisca vitripennis]
MNPPSHTATTTTPSISHLGMSVTHMSTLLLAAGKPVTPLSLSACVAGGLKLKISALKIPKKPVVREESSSSSSSDERDNSSSDEEADKSSDASQGRRTPVQRKHYEPEAPKPPREAEPAVKIAMESPSKDEDDKRRRVAVEEKKEPVKTSTAVSEEKVVKPSSGNGKLVKEESRSSGTSLRGSARLANLKSEVKFTRSPTKVNSRTSEPNKIARVSKTVSPTKSVEKSSSPPTTVTRQRNFRKKAKPASEQQKTPPKVGN